MPLAANCFFEEFRAKGCEVEVVELGHCPEMFVQLWVELASKILAAQAQAAALSWSLKNMASFSMWLTPGSAISWRQIFSTVLRGTPEPSETCWYVRVVEAS